MTLHEWFTSRNWTALHSEFEFVVQKRKLLLLAVACLRRVEDRLPGEAVRRAVDTTEAFVRGRTTFRDLVETWALAEESSGEGLWLDWSGFEELASEEEEAFTLDNLLEVVHTPAIHAARALILARTLAAEGSTGGMRDAAIRVEGAAQHELYLDLVGEPFDWPRPPRDWLSHPTVGPLLEVVRRQPDGLAFAVLADALEEAGYIDLSVLDHLRQGTRHFPGCWALESLCGREARALRVDGKRIGW